MSKKWILTVCLAVIVFVFTIGALASIKLNEAYSQGTKNNTAPDFVELYNDADVPVDVSGYRIYDPGAVPPNTKPKKVLPAGTVIPAYGFLAINTDYTSDPASDFGLSSSGDEVWLEDASGTVIDYVKMPAMAVGQSYQRIPDGGAWKLSSPITKGATNVVVKMNEIYSTGTSDNPDWIELYNNCADTIDISGYKIYDSGGKTGTKPKKSIPAGTTMPPKSFFVIVTDKTGDAADFGLSSSGETVWLEDSSGVVVDTVAFIAMVAGESYSRIPDGGPWQKTTQVTRGASNGTSSAVAQRTIEASDYRLQQNYPNPFNPLTQIEFTLPKSARVTLSIYDLLGHTIRQIFSGTLDAGTHTVTVSADDLSSGVYLYRLQTPEFSQTRRMIVIK